MMKEFEKWWKYKSIKTAFGVTTPQNYYTNPYRTAEVAWKTALEWVLKHDHPGVCEMKERIWDELKDTE